MSATRNPYYQLPGGADLPGDVRVSDTADASKTAAGGWAASPAAVQSVGKLANVHTHYFDVHDDSSTSFTFHFKVNKNAAGDSFRAVFFGFLRSPIWQCKRGGYNFYGTEYRKRNIQFCFL